MGWVGLICWAVCCLLDVAASRHLPATVLRARVVWRRVLHAASKKRPEKHTNQHAKQHAKQHTKTQNNMQNNTQTNAQTNAQNNTSQHNAQNTTTACPAGPRRPPQVGGRPRAPAGGARGGAAPLPRAPRARAVSERGEKKGRRGGGGRLLGSVSLPGARSPCLGAVCVFSRIHSP